MEKYQGILFDLDGTLLQIDTDGFYQSYLDSLSAVFPEIARDRFIDQLVASTVAMVTVEDPGKTNEQVFAADFYPKIGLDPDYALPLIEKFYREEFPKLERFGRAKPGARTVVEYALNRGIGVVIATHPIFPELAIRDRLRWAGLEDLPFTLVTTYERMHFCKPHQGYYREILDITGFDASRSIMVGNDVTDDMAAKKVGMEAYLITDQVIPREDGLPWDGLQGTLDDFLAHLKDGRDDL